MHLGSHQTLSYDTSLYNGKDIILYNYKYITFYLFLVFNRVQPSPSENFGFYNTF